MFARYLLRKINVKLAKKSIQFLYDATIEKGTGANISFANERLMKAYLLVRTTTVRGVK